MPEPIEFTLSHMLAQQRHEADECSFLCSFCLTEAENFLKKRTDAIINGWCMKDLFSGCDCPKCKEEG